MQVLLYEHVYDACTMRDSYTGIHHLYIVFSIRVAVYSSHDR